MSNNKTNYMKKIGLLLCLFSFVSFSQTVNKEKIAQALDNYYQFDRENIHLHLNRTTFLSTETIWFKGYIFDKKTSTPNLGTTNVYVSLYNSERKEISNDLFFATNGTVEGQIELDNKLDSGIYYLHVYTNFMNNFDEDESSIHEIEIINPKHIGSKKNNLNTNLSLQVNYEGGKLLTDCDNNVVLTVKDCQNKGVAIDDIKVFDEKQKLVLTFSTNKNGHGKFILPKTKNEFYTIVSQNPTFPFSEKLQKPVSEGFNLILDNYTNPEVYMVEIRTNPETSKKYDNEELFLLIQKDRATRFITFKIQKNVALKFTLDKKNFFEGINTLRLIDKNLNQISERILYKKENNTPIIDILNFTTEKDSIKIKAKVTNKDINFSISALPQSPTKHLNNSIFKTLGFDNYLKYKIDGNLLDKSKTTPAEFDLFLISNVSKYDWNSILTKTPKNTFEFESGIDLTVKMDKSNLNKNTNKLSIFTTNGIKEIATANSESEFIFKNILALDSLAIHYKFLEKPDLANKIKVSHSLKKNKSKFNNLNTTDFSKCLISYSNSESTYSYDYTTSKTTELNDVEVVQSVKPKLQYNNFPSTSSAKGYKITETVSDTYKDVLSFIASHEYDVVIDGTYIEIKTRNKRSFLGHMFPIVMLNNSRITNNSELLNLKLIDVDEIYINNRGAGFGTEGMNGVISIFTKKSPTFNPLPESKKTNFFFITNGFKNVIPFNSSQELTSQSESVFKEYGTLDFTRIVESNSDGTFEYVIPLHNQNEIILNIQGTDSKGQLYYQNIELKIK